MPRLPFEVVEVILCYLPVKPLKRFRCVAKSWRFLIDSDRFIKSHLEMTLRTNSHRHVIVFHGFDVFSFSLDNADPLKASDNVIKTPFFTRVTNVLSSCNGLFLVLGGPRIIWNPFTTEFKYLPGIRDDDLPVPSGSFSNIAYGFAYDSENDDYKVVRVVTHIKILRRISVTSRAHIYSLKSNSWRLIAEEFTYPIVNNVLTHVNGVFHSLSNAYTSPEDTTGHTIIMAFSVESEKHYEVKLPPGLSNGCDGVRALYNLGGCLAFIYYGRESGAEIWVMKEYGLIKSWTKMLSIPYCHKYIKPLATTKDGNKFMFHSDFSFFSHNLRNAADLKSVPINGLPAELDYLEVSIESLVFLHGEKQVQRQGRLHGDQDEKQDKNEIRKKRFKLKR